MTRNRKKSKSNKKDTKTKRFFNLDSPAGIMALAFTVGLIVRFGYIAFFRESPFFDGLIVDAQWHDEWARSWAEGSWSMNGRAFFRAPLYPLLLATVYRMFGHDLMALRIVQALLGGSTVAALAGCGWRLGGRKTAIWSTVISALYSPLIYFDGELLIPSLLVALLSWSLLFLLARPSVSAYVISAILLGFAAIARPTVLVLLPVFLIFIWVRIRDEKTIRRSKLVPLMIAAVLVPAFCISLINMKEETFVFISSQGGVNFYAGNHGEATGRTVNIPEIKSYQGGWANFVDASFQVAERDASTPLNSREVSDYWVRKAMNWIERAPGDAVMLTLRKTYYLLNAYEIPNNRDLYFHRPFPLNLLLWKVSWFAFPWGLVFPLAVVGAILGLRKREERMKVSILVGWFVVYGFAVVMFFVTSRFRMGLIPAILPLAAMALSNGMRSWRIPTLAVGAAALVLVNTSLFAVRLSNPAENLAKLSVALLSTDKLDESKRALREALKEKPNSPEYTYLLGQVYYLDGNQAEARKFLRRSLELGPTNYQVLLHMGSSLLQLGSHREAVAALDRAARMRPKEAEVWTKLGRAYEYSGQMNKAFESYSRSITVDPNHEQGYVDLGFLYQQQDDNPSAITIWRRGTEHVPNSFILHFNLASIRQKTKVLNAS